MATQDPNPDLAPPALPAPIGTLGVLLPVAALLLANVLRVYFPGLPTDVLFGLAVLGLGLSLLRNPGPWPRMTLVCFAALIALYSLGLAIEFSVEGMRNLAAVLCAAAVFLFGFRNAAVLIRRRALAAMLPVAMAALLLLYWTPASLDPHTLSAFLGYSLLIIGLVLSAGDRRRWTQILFPLAIGIGIAFDNRSLAIAALAGYAAYWMAKPLLHNWRRALGMALGLGLLICSPVALMVGLHNTDALAALDQLSKRSTGGRLKSGRQVMWRLALDRIAAAPWLGRGAGAQLTSADIPPTAPADAQPAAKLSCLEQGSPGIAADCALLLEIRHILTGLGGDRRMLWSWNLRSPLSRWRGVVLDGQPPRIVELKLRNSRLHGSIPPQLGDLDGLRVLNLSNNQLTGSIPPELGKLRSLQFLALDGNRLSGPIPPQLAQMPSLRVLRIADGNAISGARGTETGSFGPVIAEEDGWIPSLGSVPKVSRSAHNLFLQVGMQTGILGMAVLALLCASLPFGLVQPGGVAADPTRPFALGAIVTAIVHSAFEVFLLQDNIVVATMAWLLIGLAVGATQVRRGPAAGIGH